MDEIAEIWIGAKLDLSNIERDLKQLDNKKFSISVEVDDKALSNFIKKQGQIQNFLYANPLRPQVDLRNVNRLESKLEELKNNYKNTEVNVKVKADLSGVDNDIVDGLVNGLISNSSKVEKAGITIAETLVKSIKDKLEIRSPSKVSTKIGINFMEGMDIGLDDKKLNTKLSAIEARFAKAKNQILSKASSGKLTNDQAYNQLAKLSRDVDQQKKILTNNNNVSVSIDDSELTNLNNKLDLTLSQLKSVQDYMNKNPLKMRVDTYTDDKEVNKETNVKQTAKDVKESFNSVADDIGKTISKSINREIKRSQSGGLFASLFSLPKAVFAGFQQGIGIAIAEQWSKGFVSVFEKRFKTSLEKIGASEALNFLNFGENVGDVLVKKLGIVEGLKGLEPIITEVQNAFAEIIPVDLIDQRLNKVEKRVIKLLDDFSKMSSLETNLKNLSNVSKSVGDIATIPVEGFDRRRNRIVREAASNIRKNYDPTKATPIESGVSGVTIVSGGFAGAAGKSSAMVANKLGILLGNQQQVIPVNNTKTDVSASNIELGMPRWLSEAGLKIAQHNIFSGINPDSVEMARKAYDVYKQDPSKKITVGGYSAGGFVAHDAKEILKTLGVPANAFAIGTPIWGKKGDLQAGEFKTVVRELDGVAQVANKLKVIFGELSSKFTTIVPGQGHELANYLSQPESQNVILGQVYGKNKPELTKNQKSPEAYRSLGYKEDAENLMSSLEYQLTNPLKDPLIAKKFLIQTYTDMKRIQSDLGNAIEELDGDMREELKMYIDGLQQGIQLIEETVGKPKNLSTQPLQVSKEVEQAQELQRSKIKSLMETLHKKDILEPIGKELGLKNVRNTNKSLLIDDILSNADLSTIKKFLPHTTPPGKDVIQEITRRKELSIPDLTATLKTSRDNIKSISETNFGNKSGRDISNVSEAIEKEYQIVISMISQGVTKDIKSVLEQQKLELGKIRAKSIREVTSQISSEAVKKRKDVAEVTQLASIDPKVFGNIQKNYQKIFSEVTRYSGVKFDPARMPELIVDDKRLDKVGAKALYDIKKNKIIIDTALQKILEKSSNQLAEHAKDIGTIVHESRHALQFSYGRTSVNDISRGVSMGTLSVPPDLISRQAAFNAAHSVNIAQQSSKRPLPQQLLKAVNKTERDAYAFEELYTNRIVQNLVNKNTQKIPSTTVDPEINQFQSFMDKVGEKIQIIGFKFKDLTNIGKQLFLALPGGQFIADLISKFRDLLSPKVAAVAQVNPLKPPTTTSNTVGNNLIGGVGDIAKEATKALKELFGEIKSIYQEFTKDLPGNNFLTSGIEKIGKMGNLFKSVIVGFIGFKVLTPIFQGIRQFADDSARIAIDMQRINNQVIASAGGGSAGLKYLNEIRKNSEDLRLNIKDSLEASAGFSASTVGTSIEGQLGTETFKNFQTLLAARGTTTERSKNFMLALEQSASKGVQAEELRGQMAEAVPGIISIFARSQGLDNRAFAAKMKNTPGGLDQSVLFEASQQAKAENLVNISKSFDTVDSSSNRFNNNLLKLQESIGALSLDFEKFKFNTLSSGFELISSNIELITKGLAVLTLYASQSIIITGLQAINKGWMLASTAIKQYIADYLLNIKIQTMGMNPLQKAGFFANNTFNKLSNTIKGFTNLAKPFVAIAIVMEAMGNIANILRIQFSDLSGDIKKYADTAKNANIEIEKSLKTGKFDETGGINDDNYFVRHAKRLRDNPLRTLNPFDQTNREGDKKAIDTYYQGDILLKESAKLRSIADSGDINKNIVDLVEIDKKRADIAAQLSARSQLSPSDSAASKALREQQDVLVKDRGDKIISIGAIQSQIESRVKELKLLRDSVKTQAKAGFISKTDYLSGVSAIDDELKKLESTQSKITKAIGESKNAFDIFKKDIQSTAVAAEDIQTAIDISATNRKNIVTERYATNQISPGDRNLYNQLLDIRSLREQRNSQSASINQKTELFRNRQATSVLSAYGVDNSTGTARIGQLADRADGNNKFILEEFAKLQKSKQDFVRLQQQISEASAALNDYLRDLTKQVDEYYRNISRNAQNTQIEIKKLNAQTRNQNMSNRLRSVLSDGYDTLIGSIVDGVEQALNNFNTVTDKALESQQQLLQSSFDIQDARRGGSELLRQIPKDIPGIKVDLDFSSIPSDNNIAQLREEVDSTIGGSESLGASINGVTGNVDELYKNLESVINPILEQEKQTDLVRQNIIKSNEELVNAGELSNQWNNSVAPIPGHIDLINVGMGSLLGTISNVLNQTVQWIANLGNLPNILGGIAGQIQQKGLLQGTADFLKGLGQDSSVSASSGIMNPVKGGVFTSGYGMRTHPVTGQRSMHSGLDIGHSGGVGTPILAPTSGVITRQYTSQHGGTSLEMKSIDSSGKEIVQSFLHLSEYVAKVGQSVKQGEQIAKMGNTGRSTGAHLHWEVKVNGTKMDPKQFLNMGINIPAREIGNNNRNTSSKSVSSGNLGVPEVSLRNKLQSLVVANSSGKILAGYNGGINPASPASTIKLIIGDLATDKLNPDQKLTVNRNAVAEYEDKFKAGQSYSVRQLLTEMLKESNNTAANALIQGLGGFGAVNSMAKSKGYRNSSINNFLSPTSGNSTGTPNKITANDATKAMADLLNDRSAGGQIASNALRQTRNFRYSGEAGGKIGNNSKVIGNVGIVNINGSEYIVTAYANVDGNKTSNRKLITNATNEISKGLMGSVTNSFKSSPISQGSTTVNGISRGGNLLTQQESSKLTNLGKKLYQYQQNPKILAFADVISRAEGTDFRNNSKNFGYSMMIGGEHDTDFSRHPFAGNSGKRIRPPRHNSTASGRYQMMDFNYSKTQAGRQWGKGAQSDLAAIFQGENPGSFSPGVQDLYFIASLKSRGVLDEVLAGNFKTALSNPNIAQHYASLQSGKNKSAHIGQGTPEGQLRNTVPFATQRLQARLKEGSPVTTAANTYTSASIPQLQFGVNSGTNLAVDTIQQRSQAQQLNNEAQQRAAQIAGDTALARVKRQTERSIRDMQDKELANRRSVTDSRFEGIAFPTLKQQQLKESTDNLRLYQDRVTDLKRSIEDYDAAIEQANKAIPEFQSSMDATTDENTRKSLQTGLEQTIKARDAYISSRKTALETLDALDKSFKDKESARIQKASWDEYQRSSKADIANQQAANTAMQEYINALEQVKQINPFDEQLDKLPELKEKLSLDQLQVELANNLLQIEDEITRSGNDQKIIEEKRIYLANLKQEYEYKKNIISTTRQQQEEELRLAQQQRSLSIDTKVNDIASQLGDARIKRVESLNNRNALGIDTGDLLKSRLDNFTNQKEALSISLESQIQDVIKFGKETGLGADKINVLIDSLTELNTINLNNLQQEFDDALDTDKVNEMTKVIDNLSNKFTLTRQPILNLRNAQADKYEQGGGNVFVANASRRRVGREQEMFNRDQSLMQLDRDVLQARLKGIEVPDSEVATLRNSIVELSEINLDNLNNQFKTIGASLGDIAKNGITQLSQGLADVITKGGSLGDVFDNLFNNILNQALNMGINSLLGGLFGGLFASGGIVGSKNGYSSDLMSTIGNAAKQERSLSGKQPTLVMAHRGELIVPADRVKELSSMGLGVDVLLNRTYAYGGVVGERSREYGSQMTTNRNNSAIQVQYQSTEIAGQKYVTEDQFQEGIRRAAEEGGKRGASIVENKLGNSPNYRRSLGF
jgi:tape measure domain-containing protein